MDKVLARIEEMIQQNDRCSMPDNQKLAAYGVLETLRLEITEHPERFTELIPCGQCSKPLRSTYNDHEVYTVHVNDKDDETCDNPNP